MYFLLIMLLVSGLMVVKTTHENRFANGLQVLREEANQLDGNGGNYCLSKALSAWTAE